MTVPEFAHKDVEDVFSSYPPRLRERLLNLRALIYQTAEQTEGVGALEETLKWGQPSYLTPQTKSGSTIRIDRLKSEDGKYAAFFHCQSNLVPMFQELYGDVIAFDGKRAMIFDQNERLPQDAVRHCLGLALTHHLRKKATRKKSP